MSTTDELKDIWFAAGCFWGAQKFFKGLEGVEFTEVGFANGNTESPTYEQVYTDATGYAECVHVRYNPQKISLRRLTELYFKIIDPLSLNKQGADEGTRYRTGVYYRAPQQSDVRKYEDERIAEDESAERRIAEDESDLVILSDVFEAVKKELKVSSLPVELLPLKNFYTADEYHQDYLDKNPSGYCHLSPELFKLKA